MSRRRCSPTTACACCCATSSASPLARPCSTFTSVSWARKLRRRPRNLFGLCQEVRARDLAGEIRMVLPQVLLRVLPELLVVLAFDGVATHAGDLLHAHIVVREKTRKLRNLDERSAKWAAATLAATTERNSETSWQHSQSSPSIRPTSARPPMLRRGRS